MHPVLRHSAAAVAALALTPAALAVLVARPRWREGWTERLGRAPRPASGAIWVHGASVGEILAATRLLDALRKRGRPVLASTTSTSGRHVLRQLRPELPSTLAPLDHPWCVETALARVAPAALVLVETELWPAWIAAADRRGVPVVVASARLSPRSFRRYRRAALLLGRTWRRLAAVGARTPGDAERFLALGVPPERVKVTGDLKLEPPERAPELAPDLAELVGNAEPVIAASTHAPEEAAALDAFDAAERAGARIPLVLAPRRLERVAEVEALVRARGRRLRRRSRPGEGRLAAGEVLLLDTLGELPALLPRAALVFVGGSLARRGGHNVVEPALAGRPVLFGPDTASAGEASERLLACGAARRVRSAAELAEAVVAWLVDRESARRAGEAGRRELERHRGTTERTLELVESALGVAR